MARKHTVLKKRMSWRGNIQFWSVRHGEETYSFEEAYVIARKHKVLKSCMSWRGNMQFSVVPQTTGSLRGVLFFLQLFNDFINTWHASLYGHAPSEYLLLPLSHSQNGCRSKELVLAYAVLYFYVPVIPISSYMI